ncbi:leucoanthocyanidin reductase-like isoform X2 [Canna indica]|uniref:Leucoanthocyanidin reductase-like isoform X2 n=1 Tax=Canna indica TaxID=4628 RepID=A0AAQ3KQM9_9LILI|nr:leucoanthocyanidin reductase-like isoform X2 [Canna indica]
MDSSAAGSAVLVVGGTGYIGRFVAEAAIASGLTTFVLVRPFHGRACPSRLAALRHRGAIILEGSAADREFVEKTLRENGIDVVVSAVGGGSILDQLSLLDAVRAAGTVKRFLPSEFGHDIDRANPVEPGLSFYKEKRRIRRAVEAAAVPYTYICCNSIAGWPYHDNTHPSEALPPVDRFVIYGDGSMRAYFVAGCDIGKFTIRAAFDPRTLNKSVHFRPTCNFINLNEMASLWETKIGFTLPRIKLSEHDLLALAQGLFIYLFNYFYYSK